MFFPFRPYNMPPSQSPFFPSWIALGKSGSCRSERIISSFKDSYPLFNWMILPSRKQGLPRSLSFLLYACFWPSLPSRSNFFHERRLVLPPFDPLTSTPSSREGRKRAPPFSPIARLSSPVLDIRLYLRRLFPTTKNSFFSDAKSKLPPLPSFLSPLLK